MGRVSPGLDPLTGAQVLAWGGEQVIARQIAIGDAADDGKVARALAESHWHGIYRR
jgi:hypothetical protein